METATRPRPHGRSQVVAALIAAATRLFAERGPGAVSLREVAREANVNLGLIHRYIGGKQELLALVLEARPGMPPLARLGRPAEDLAELVLELIEADAQYTRVVLRATLDGFEVPQIQTAFPMLERATTAMREVLPQRDADVRVGLLSAAIMGWQALAPLLLEVVGQEGLSVDELLDVLRPAIVGFLSAEPSQHL